MTSRLGATARTLAAAAGLQTSWCAVMVHLYQRVQVPPEELSIHLGRRDERPAVIPAPNGRRLRENGTWPARPA